MRAASGQIRLDGDDAEPVLFDQAARDGTLGEQWIKESKSAIKWTRPSCRSFAMKAVRLQLHAQAYITAQACLKRRTGQIGERPSGYLGNVG